MKKKKNRLNTFLVCLIFLIGAAIMSYPFISDYYYHIESNRAISDFEVGKNRLSKEELQKRLNLAHAYNVSLLKISNISLLEDPYSEKEIKEGIKAYAKSLEIHERLGHIKIPRINQDVPIYAGIAESVLQKGIGHMQGTSLPIGGENTHCVLTGHRGLPSAKLFTDLNKLEIGDKFYIYNIEGTLAYQVDQIKVVKPSEFQDLVIHKGKDEVTLLTCTPYMINSHRLLVRGHRIEYEEAIEKKEVEKGRKELHIKIIFIIILIVLSIITIRLLLKRKKRKMERELTKK